MDTEAIALKPLVELRVINSALEAELRSLSKDPLENAELMDEKEAEWLFVQMKIYEKEFDNYLNKYELISYETACDIGDTTILPPLPNDVDELEEPKSQSQQIVQCVAYINQLKRVYPKIPNNIDFYILENGHDLGDYLTPAIVLNEEDNEEDSDYSAYDFVNDCENGFDEWDETAIDELTRYKYFEW